MDLSLHAFLGYIGGGTSIILIDHENMNKIYWQGTIDEYFQSDKLPYWWNTVQSAYVDENSLIVLIYDNVK